MNNFERSEWLKERKTYIGGSDIGCILGLSPYKTALDIFNEKTTSKIDEVMSEAARFGIIHEETIAKEYSRCTGFKVEKPVGLIRHPEHKFLAANIDRWVVDEKGGDPFILECKTAHFHKSKEWGEEGSDQIPELYRCQVAYYSAICNIPKVDIAVLIGGNDFRIYTYLKNEEFENKLIKAAGIFWNNYVLKNVTPTATNLSDVMTLYPKSNGNAIKADDQIAANIEELKSIKLQEKILAKNKEMLEINIRSYIGNNEALLSQDEEVLATWRSGRERKVLDIVKFQAEHQNLYQQYLTDKEASRIFLIK